MGTGKKERTHRTLIESTSEADAIRRKRLHRRGGAGGCRIKNELINVLVKTVRKMFPSGRLGRPKTKRECAI